MKAADVATWIAIAGAFVAAGASWGTLNTKVDRLSEKVTELQEEDANTLCLAVVTRQVIAIEKEREPVQQKLGALAERYCQDPKNPDVELATATREMTPEEKRRAEAEALEERRAFIRSLKEIDEKLGRTSPSLLM